MTAGSVLSKPTTRTAGVSPVSLFLRELAATRPDEVALKIDEQIVSYQQLNAEADSLARRLIEDGTSEGARVAVRANATHATAVAFLAIQRAGLVLVMVDPTAPHDRVRQIVADVDAELLLSDIAGDEDLPLPIGDPLAWAAETDPSPVDRERGELASIVFTSGSTGTPKGIMIGQRRGDILRTRPHRYGLPANSRLGGIIAGTAGPVDLLIASSLFLEGPFLVYEIRRHGVAPLQAWLERERVESLATVPTVLRHLLSTLSPGQRLPDLRTVSLFGETSTWEDVKRLREHLSPELVISNVFGQTEAGLISSVAITPDVPLGSGRLPVGKPPAEALVNIVGEDGEPVADGERGEIVVEGPGCALGYWRRPDLTESIFTLMPSGYYRIRTGDGGRFLADGSLEHFGRIDHVVKISGNRTELGEVESALARLDGVAAAAATTYIDETESTRLTAAVTATPGATLDPLVLRAALSRRLPGFMIPDYIAVVDELPQLVGGKTDRERVAQLRSLEADPVVDQGREPSALERTLREIWCDVLGRRTVGLHDDFADLGGDSIRAARMFIELERRSGIDRPMSLLAEAPTIASLALALADDSGWSALLPVQTKGSQPPLFVVHDGTGSIGAGRDLVAALGPDQPVYAIRCEGLNGQPCPYGSAEELAATYIERVRALYPRGPYVLYGASLGGVIAMEMSRQLLRDGEDVPLAIIGDSVAPGTPTRHALSAAERRGARLRELRQMPATDRAKHLIWLARRQVRHHRLLLSAEGFDIRRQVRAVDRALERGEPIPAAARGRYVMREYGALLRPYRPRAPFPARVLLLRTGGPGDVPDRGWRALVGDALEVVDVPVSHADLGREKSGKYVGPILAEALGRLR
jgi:acyl-coenzyme A synthetase/AMP-(fatty) acid ligase/thioesterase domain-containing protein/acyl carrier protein